MRSIIALMFINTFVFTTVVFASGTKTASRHPVIDVCNGFETTVTVPSVKLHDGDPVIGYLKKGAKVTVIGEKIDGFWYRVKTMSGKEGIIAAWTLDARPCNAQKKAAAEGASLALPTENQASSSEVAAVASGSETGNVSEIASKLFAAPIPAAPEKESAASKDAGSPAATSSADRADRLAIGITELRLQILDVKQTAEKTQRDVREIRKLIKSLAIQQRETR